MLIQRVSPPIPVIHIKMECLDREIILSVFQGMKGICNDLPRLPDDVCIVKVICVSVNWHGESMNNAFIINRKCVIDAL